MMRGVALQGLVVERGGFKLQVDDLRAKAGAIVCIVGPNGGGKTTLLLAILGLIPHDGKCLVNGRFYDGAQADIKSTMGFVPDDPTLLFEELTAEEQWALTASVIADIRPDAARQVMQTRSAMLAHQLAFEPPPVLIRQYSHGMRKKTQIVNALLGSPQIIVVDELRNGLDPIAIKQTEDLMRAERARGAAIIAATHDLWWAERFADYIYVLHKGKIVARGTLKQLLCTGESHMEEAFFRIVGRTS